ncbi:MAG: hypothetical protein WDN00_00440 [Limisphaerales bacterium]
MENLSSTTKGASAATADLSKEMGVINVTHEDVAAATKKTAGATSESTEKFAESHREIRKVGNELGRMIGLADVGGLALGGTAAAAFAAVKAVEFLKGTWEGLQETINGPIQIGIPEKAAEHITAAANAWNQYATARAKVIEASGTAEATASAREISLAKELKLIKEVLAAEKEKALADLALKKDSMTPEAYAAAQANISNIFSEAGTAADQKNRRALIANKDVEATNLEIDAEKKKQQALALKFSPKEVAEVNQKTLDDNAAKAEKAKEEITERMALITRFADYKSGKQSPAEYSGSRPRPLHQRS